MLDKNICDRTIWIYFYYYQKQNEKDYLEIMGEDIKVQELTII